RRFGRGRQFHAAIEVIGRNLPGDATSAHLVLDAPLAISDAEVKRANCLYLCELIIVSVSEVADDAIYILLLDHKVSIIDDTVFAGAPSKFAVAAELKFGGNAGLRVNFQERSA